MDLKPLNCARKGNESCVYSAFTDLIMRTAFTTLFLALTISALAETVPLFDGKTFTGWEGDIGSVWRIEDGALVAGSLEKKQEKNNFLATTKPYANFELTLKWKLEGTEGFVNGGVQFRTKRIPNHHEVSGFQADLGKGYDGALYDESRRKKMMAQPTPEVLAKAQKPLANGMSIASALKANAFKFGSMACRRWITPKLKLASIRVASSLFRFTAARLPSSATRTS
jgi:hypothetical protein